MFYVAAWLKCYGRLCVEVRYYLVSVLVIVLVPLTLAPGLPALPTAFTSVPTMNEEYINDV